jgi:hypothetical protein
MLRVIDENGNVLEGLYRNEVGAIVIDDHEEYEKYILEKKRLEQINSLSSDMDTLKSEMSELKTLLVDFLNKANK